MTQFVLLIFYYYNTISVRYRIDARTVGHRLDLRLLKKTLFARRRFCHRTRQPPQLRPGTVQVRDPRAPGPQLVVAATGRLVPVPRHRAGRIARIAATVPNN